MTQERRIDSFEKLLDMIRITAPNSPDLFHITDIFPEKDELLAIMRAENQRHGDMLITLIQAICDFMEETNKYDSIAEIITNQGWSEFINKDNLQKVLKYVSENERLEFFKRNSLAAKLTGMADNQQGTVLHLFKANERAEIEKTLKEPEDIKSSSSPNEKRASM